MLHLLAFALATPLLSGCFWGFVHDEVLDAPYHLVAVDTMEQMALSIPIGGGDYSGDGLPGPTIFAAGADARYVVVARHPAPFGGDMDRNVTEYWYLVRHADEASGRARPIVRGPYGASAFAYERRRLGLPPFTRVFDELR